MTNCIHGQWRDAQKSERSALVKWSRAEASRTTERWAGPRHRGPVLQSGCNCATRRLGKGRGTNCGRATGQRQEGENLNMCTKSFAKSRTTGSREGRGRVAEVEGFNWALGSRTCRDNIKGQIYINCCWERMTWVQNRCRAEGRQEDTGRKATRGK